jgi:4-hydroxybenzoate polyprenyltransferase
MAGLTDAGSRFFAGLRETGEMIAFKHTVFALPFAVIALITAAAPTWPAPRIWLWVAVAMVSARTAAMAFNRLADHRIDVENPRTADRALPAGRLSRRFAWVVTGASAALFLVAAASLNPLCLVLE